MAKFHENENHKTKIVDDGSIEKYGLVLCHNPKNKGETFLPQILDLDKRKEKTINLQCRKGFLLNDKNMYTVYDPLCNVAGYDPKTCPSARIMSWESCVIFGSVCKFHSGLKSEKKM